MLHSSSELGLKGLLQRGSEVFWNYFAEKEKLYLHLFFALFALSAGLILRFRAPASFLKNFVGGSALLERVYIFLDLHNPLFSWWTAVALIAAMISLIAGPIIRYRSEGMSPKEIISFFLMITGFFLFITGYAVERYRSISGEMLLREKIISDRVFSGPDFNREILKAGFMMEAADINESGIRFRISRENNIPGEDYVDGSLSPGEIFSFEDIYLELRRIRPVEERFVFELEITGIRSGEKKRYAAAAGQRIRLDDNLNFRVVDFNRNYKGLGPAIRVLKQGETGYLPDNEYGSFWVFQRYPDFDFDNRAKKYAFRFIDMPTDNEAVIAVSRHPGLAMLFFGLLFWVTGFIFMKSWTACRREKNGPGAIMHKECRENR